LLLESMKSSWRRANLVNFGKQTCNFAQHFLHSVDESSRKG
jgi:hypothetical protein